MTAGFVEFEFDLPDALLNSIVDIFSNMDGAPLLLANIVGIPEQQGVYQLLLRGEIVYIGKTDADSGLRKRLERHARTIQHRIGIAPEEVTFKAIRVFVFTAMDLETQLIRHYGNTQWNSSGFGSNDPGRERDTTNTKPDAFDAIFPIDIDREITLNVDTGAIAATVLAELNKTLPYILRVESTARGKRGFHQDIHSVNVMLPQPPFTTRSIIEAVLKVLPTGWQATVLAGRIIMYRENREYPSGTVIGRSV